MLHLGWDGMSSMRRSRRAAEHGHTRRASARTCRIRRPPVTRRVLVPRLDRVIAPDLPGHGFAAASPGWPMTVPGHRDFVIQLAATCAPAGPAVLVGHSLGGHVAAAAVLAAPELASHLVLVAPTGITMMGRTGSGRPRSDNET